MSDKTYKEKLLDPRWQRRRLQILSRNNFTCEAPGCYNSTETLHVHHVDYLPNTEPWDYSDDYLMTLCASCHEQITEFRPLYEKELIHHYRMKLKDSFLLNCTKEVFKVYSDLGDLMFLLWEFRTTQQEVHQLLSNYYLKRIPIEYLKPIEDAEPDATRLDR